MCSPSYPLPPPTLPLPMLFTFPPFLFIAFLPLFLPLQLYLPLPMCPSLFLLSSPSLSAAIHAISNDATAARTSASALAPAPASISAPASASPLPSRLPARAGGSCFCLPQALAGRCTVLLLFHLLPQWFCQRPAPCLLLARCMLLRQVSIGLAEEFGRTGLKHVAATL